MRSSNDPRNTSPGAGSSAAIFRRFRMTSSRFTYKNETTLSPKNQEHFGVEMSKVQMSARVPTRQRRVAAPHSLLTDCLTPEVARTLSPPRSDSSGRMIAEPPDLYPRLVKASFFNSEFLNTKTKGRPRFQAQPNRAGLPAEAPVAVPGIGARSLCTQRKNELSPGAGELDKIASRS